MYWVYYKPPVLSYSGVGKYDLSTSEFIFFELVKVEFAIKCLAF